MIHLAIIDGSRVFADALAASLSAELDIRVVRCATGHLALRQALDHSSADVVVCDDALFEDALFDADNPLSVVGATPRPRAPLDLVSRTDQHAPPRPAVVLIADHADVTRLAACIRWGVRAWVLRCNSMDDLIDAIREAATGGTWIPPKELTRVLRELVWSSSEDDPFQVLMERLTRRERDVLTCLVEGLNRPEVAMRLQLSTNTVRTHVQSILSKLGVNSCVAAVALVRRTSSTVPRMAALT